MLNQWSHQKPPNITFHRGEGHLWFLCTGSLLATEHFCLSKRSTASMLLRRPGWRSGACGFLPPTKALLEAPLCPAFHKQMANQVMAARINRASSTECSAWLLLPVPSKKCCCSLTAVLDHSSHSLMIYSALHLLVTRFIGGRDHPGNLHRDIDLCTTEKGSYFNYISCELHTQ